MNSNFLTIFRREISAYFNSAIAYIFIIVFVLLNGGLFMTQFFLYGRADMRPFFTTLPFVLAVFLPAVTMRLWAEEKRGNTLELLLTFPVPTHTLVLGKFLAGLVFYLISLLATVTIPIMLLVIGKPDTGTILGGYLGAALLGAFYLSVGIFISGLCRDQIVAFILSMIICFGLHLTGMEYLSSSIDGWLPGFGSFLQRFIGSATHFSTFEKGVIDTSDLLYFIIGTLVFLVLNGFWFEGRMRTGAKKIFTAATVISVGIFLMSNWLLADLPLGRYDLTEGQIYTIAPATKQILKSLKAPVTAKFYVSSIDKMPTGMKTLEQDVVDKLDEFKVSSNGNFEYKIFHMEASNVTEQPKEAKKEGEEEPLEKQLQTRGINPFQVKAVESDEVAVRLVYSSISLSYKEKPEEIIPRIMPENLHQLEYTLISKIYRMTLDKTPKIALVAPYEEKEVQPEVKALLEQLGGQMPQGLREDYYEVLPMALEYEGYKVERIKLTEKEPIPDGTTTLVVVEPRMLNERQRYEINQFLVGGGSLFLAVQNYEYNYQPTGNQLGIYPQEKKPQINDLLRQWGFEVDEQILVDEQHDVINLSGVRLGPFDMAIPVKIPIQVLVTAAGMNQTISITSRLSSIFYLWGTALKLDETKIKEQNLKVEKLLYSSRNSWTVPFKSGTLAPQDLIKQSEGKTGPFPLSVYVTGQFIDAFKGKSIPEWPKEAAEKAAAGAEEKMPPELAAALAGAAPGPGAEEEKEAVEEKSPEAVTPAQGKLVLIGASTPFQKHLVRGGGHLNFFMNSIDAISLGEELVTIRSKQPIDRSLGRLTSAAKMGWRIFVTFLVPVLIAIAGTTRMFWRRQAKQIYLRNYAEAIA